jgi:hypothetical protein
VTGAKPRILLFVRTLFSFERYLDRIIITA